MTRLQVIRLVAGREIRERVRSKAFLVSTGFSLLIVLAIAILPGVLGDDGPTTYDVGVVGAPAEALVDRFPSVAELVDEDVEVRVRRLSSAEEADRLVESGDLDAAVVGDEVVADEELGDRLGFIVQEAHRQVVTEQTLGGAGVTGDVADRVLRPPPLGVRLLDPPTDDETAREGLVFVGTILLYGQLLGFGYWVASGVVEEKVSRVIEILLAKVPPTQLLAGKIVGIGVLGFCQLVGFVVLGLVAAATVGSIDLPPETPGVAAQVVLWFILGFAFYSALFAVGGALASRVEELQSTTAPLTLVAMASLFVAVAAGSDPSGVVAQVATFVPPSAPLVLPIRSAAGEIGVGAMALSVAVVLASIYAVITLAARAYSGGALHVRGQLGLRRALAAARARREGA